jgi:hypothetical protein
MDARTASQERLPTGRIQDQAAPRPCSFPVAGVSVDRCSPDWLPKKACLSLSTRRQPPGPFPRTGRQPPRRLMGASPLLRRSTLLKKQGTTARQRRGSGETPVALRMYERTGGDTVPPSPPKTAKNQMFQRIPLAPRYFRGRRCSAPRWCRIVGGGPNPHPGLRYGVSPMNHRPMARQDRLCADDAERAAQRHHPLANLHLARHRRLQLRLARLRPNPQNAIAARQLRHAVRSASAPGRGRN